MALPKRVKSLYNLDWAVGDALWRASTSLDENGTKWGRLCGRTCGPGVLVNSAYQRVDPDANLQQLAPPPADQLGFVVGQTAAGHTWERITCSCRAMFSVWSTPKIPFNHSRQIEDELTSTTTVAMRRGND